MILSNCLEELENQSPLIHHLEPDSNSPYLQKLSINLDRTSLFTAKHNYIFKEPFLFDEIKQEKLKFPESKPQEITQSKIISFAEDKIFQIEDLFTS